jgi:hypothetical protein
LAANTKPNGWQAAPTASFGVGKELCRRIWNGLNDPNCIEIGFVLIPDTAVSIVSMNILTISGATYTMLITIKTKRFDQ